MSKMDASRLPDRPDLAHERKRAKQLLRALRRCDPEAVARLLARHPRFADSKADELRAADLKLNDAQLVIAREYGLASWPALKASIERVTGSGLKGAYSVLAWNDDATSMEFVVHLLKEVFHKSEADANQIMLETHHNGFGVWAVYERLDEAESKIAEARDLARRHGYPLELTYAHGDAGQKGKPTRSVGRELDDNAKARSVRIGETKICLELMDGRDLSFPLAWFPELLNASPDQRHRYFLSEHGRTLFWSELGLVVSVAGLLLGPDGQIAFRRASPSSVMVCRAALAECSRKREPLKWARAQSALGNAFLAQGVSGHSTAHLDDAVSAYRAALEEYGRAYTAPEWAATQLQLGHALVVLGGHESGTAKLEEAVAAYRAALTDRNQLQQWASAQFNLGSALVTLGEREGGTTRFEEAVAAYRAALKQHTRERAPLQWAMCMGGQGVALARLAERLGDVRMAESAISLIEAAIEPLRERDHPKFAAHPRELELVTGYIESNLQKTVTLVDRLNTP